MPEIRLGRYEAEEGELPPLCLRCGAPATVFKARLLSWQPAWTYVVFGLAFWPIVLATLVLRKRMRLLAPFCRKHRNYWQRQRLLSWAVFFGLTILFLPLITAAATIDDPASRFPNPLLLFWLAGMAITFAVEFVHLGAIRATEITDDAIALTNVADAFVAQWRIERQSPGHDKPEAPANLGSGPALRA
jgi:hypothetical protein